MSGSRVSKGGSALARAFLFQARTANSAYDPPPLTRDLVEIVTFGCGQLEQLPKSDDGIDDGIGGDPDDDIDGAEELDDLAIMKRPVLFKGYLELNEQISQRRVREWLMTGVGKMAVFGIEIKPAYLKDREQHMALRADPETRFKGPLDLILRGSWRVGKDTRKGPGARNDMEAIREILREFGPEEGVRRVAEEYPGQFVRYPSGITQLAQAVIPRVREGADFKFRPWQAAIFKILEGKPHPRHIYWIEDPRGAAGKSRLTTYLCREKDAVELDGRQMDAAFSYTGQRIVIFDLARAVEAATLKDLYIVGEKLKNGQIYSSKYQSRLKVFNVPHVVYFSNSPPPIGVWSADRLQHILLSEPVPFNAGSHDLEEEPEVPEPTGAELFQKLLDEEKDRRAAGKKRAREDEGGEEGA
jgi:hypothetical protein